MVAEGSLFPLFLKMMKINIRKAIATYLYLDLFLQQLLGLLYFGLGGDTSFLPALCVMVGSISGVRIGILISLKIKPS